MAIRGVVVNDQREVAGDLRMIGKDPEKGS
jgi:hypothetical protein